MLLSIIPYLNKSILEIFINRISPISNSFRIFILKEIGIKIDSDCLVGKNVTVKLGLSQGKKGEINIRAKSEICNGVNLECWGGAIDIDENVFIGPYTIIYGNGGVKIGRDTLIATHCKIISSNHTIPSKNTRIRSQPDILLPVTIGDDVWLGAGVTVLGGITIGNGCIVGAGAVVTKDLAPYSIAVGIPAKVIRTRL
ncbi:MAG: transferase [Pseudanabaena frigida]|uniref:Transferase n=1 Tax=Pseudanabaena frigida TaxID=945775 RepID=A0A2W4W0R1_9CYAN|nr:MAG: transferase [Pseudanabaena frigida]